MSPVAHVGTGAAWVDTGLGAFLKAASYGDAVWGPAWGMQKVPTLRNVDLWPSKHFEKAYGHNGYFKSLEEILHFYNTRDVPGVGWPAPEVAVNINTTELGNLGLNHGEELAAIVAFLGTLSDGYIAQEIAGKLQSSSMPSSKTLRVAAQGRPDRLQLKRDPAP